MVVRRCGEKKPLSSSSSSSSLRRRRRRRRRRRCVVVDASSSSMRRRRRCVVVVFSRCMITLLLVRLSPSLSPSLFLSSFLSFSLSVPCVCAREYCGRRVVRVWRVVCRARAQVLRRVLTSGVEVGRERPQWFWIYSVSGKSAR